MGFQPLGREISLRLPEGDRLIETIIYGLSFDGKR